MKSGNIFIFFVALLSMLEGFPLRGAVFYMPDRNAIRIHDYPLEAPCTLERLYKFDRILGWQKIEFDRQNSTFTINCDLIIGANDGTDTVLQVGSCKQPRETLIMKGNIYIYPYFIKEENEGKYWQVPRRNNALLVGDKNDPAINASLKFACTENQKYTLYCGRFPGKDKRGQFGGGLYVYNSRISPLQPGSGCMIGDAKNGNMYLLGNVVLDHAEITGVRNALYGMSNGYKKEYLIKNTTFKQVGIPLLNGNQRASDCAFANCQIVVNDSGSLNAELTNCVFNDNQINWSLTHSDKGLILVDCYWTKPVKPNVLLCRERNGKVLRPQLVCRRHLVVRVVNQIGNPVADAEIKVAAEQKEKNAPQTQFFKTSKTGKTAGQQMKNAILLTEFIITATDNPKQPTVKTYTYTITASKDGNSGVIDGLVPDQSWKIVKIILKSPAK